MPTAWGLSLSYDKGEANGGWASLSGDQLTGKNVEDNWRVRWMTGYYYKVINQNNRRVTIGLNNMIWHYDKDLSGYSLGQGGYYSPQEYLSFAIPVMWRERTENWSWELGGVWLVVAFTHQNHAALSADESDPDRLAGKKLRGNPTMAAAVRALATRRGHYLNDVLLPTGLSAQQLISSRRKIIRPAISCSMYVIPPPDGRVTWIYHCSH